MKRYASENRSVVSIEDPVECTLPWISQTSVGTADLSYAAGLKGLLRQDPDVIMVGEIRDFDTAHVAFEAALTGHSLVSCIHGGSIRDVLFRLRTFSLSPELIAHATKLIIAQRLVPKLCDACKVFDLKSSNQAGFQIYKEVGCKRCEGSGYVGKQPYPPVPSTAEYSLPLVHFPH